MPSACTIPDSMTDGKEYYGRVGNSACSTWTDIVTDNINPNYGSYQWINGAAGKLYHSHTN